ncbi:MAG TPA: DUF362 domain-containing protein [Bryobacteraceae bacterium]|nr:DUF362 domain-containing protein [Bryobacteraceae bacterium]
MTLGRREFIGTALASLSARAFGRESKPYFGLHSFIEANPKAVFIRRTHVADKMDGPAKLREGLELAREIFLPLDKPGVPVTHRIILKPNFTSVRDRSRPAHANMGTGTDPQFYEGLVLGMKEVGLRNFHWIEANNYPAWNLRGFVDINERLGVRMNEPEVRPRQLLNGEGVTWSTVPDGVVFKRIPHFAPVNEPDTWLLNIAKWKAHGMCLTQSVKNEQGLIPLPYVRFCHGWGMVTGVPDYMKPDIHPRVETVVNSFFERHGKMGYARWDSKAGLSPIRQEIWAHKTCDHQSVLRTGLSIIEGIYGRDGDGFGTGNDRLANIVLFGNDKFRLDVIGLYLAGHEPGNIALYRIAKERGLSDTFNPWEIPVFEWQDGRAVPRKLADLPRTPLPTYYLQKPGEPLYHLVNEPFDYDRHKV